MVGESCIDSAAETATGSLWVSDEGGTAVPAELGSPLICSAFCSLTFKISGKG